MVQTKGGGKAPLTSTGDDSMKSAKELRDKRNAEIQERIKNPDDNLSSFSSHQSWFPQRPIIEKDKKAMAKLHSKSKEYSKKPKTDDCKPKAKKTVLTLV